MNCSTPVCDLSTFDSIDSLGHYLPLLFVIGFVYVIFTRNVSGAVLSLLPFWIVAWSYPIRQHDFACGKDHIMFEYVFHVWSSYALGIIVGMVATLAFELPLLYDDKIIDPSRKLRRGVAVEETDHESLLKKKPLRAFDLQYLTFLISALGIYFGVKLIRGHYLEPEKCFGFLNETQSNIWGAFFIVIFSILAIGTFFWCLFRRNNVYSNRSNLKYGIPLFFFLIASVIIFEVVDSGKSLWFGLFYLLALLVFFIALWFWIGYVGMGLILLFPETEPETQSKGHNAYSNVMPSFDLSTLSTKHRPAHHHHHHRQHKVTQINCKPNSASSSSSCKRWDEIYDEYHDDQKSCGKEVWWYKCYLDPFYGYQADDEDFKDVVRADRVGTKRMATFMCSLTFCIAFLTFLVAWIVNVVTDSDSDSVLFTLFAFSLFYLIFLPLLSICVSVNKK